KHPCGALSKIQAARAVQAAFRGSPTGKRRDLSQAQARGANFVSGMDRGSQIAPARLSWVARRQASRGSSVAGERHGLTMASRARAAKSGDRNTLKGITHPDKVFWPEEGYTKL